MRILALLLLVLAAGCGRGVDTGVSNQPPGDDDDDTATTPPPGDDDDDGGTPGSTTPAQDSTVPATVGALLGLQRLRTNTGTDDFEGGGWFMSQAMPTGGAGFKDLFH